jgi:hypothetical protein
MVINVNGGNRITYTFDEVHDETGELISQNNRGNFFVVDDTLRKHVEAIRKYIGENKLND